MKSKRIIYVDVIRDVAMLAVVFIHTCSNMVVSGQGSILWAPANILETISEIAVPLFYMISGVTILNSSKTRDLKYLFKHRIVRIVVPFILWSIISAFSFQITGDGFKLDLILKKIAMMFNQPVIMAFWFLYPLIGFYLLSPAIKAFIDGASKSVINYILVLWYITNIFLPGIVASLPPEYGVYFNAYSSVFMFLCNMGGYFILGYKLSNIDKEKINLKLHTSIFSIGMLVAIINMYIVHRYALEQKPLAGFPTAILLPILAGSLFLILKKFEGKYPVKLQVVVEWVAPLTYGIYLIHGIVIALVQSIIDPMKYVFVFPVAIVICIVSVWIMSKIPIVNKYLM
ncbi:acyltransferase [Companilactobacillus insicii]|uniref:acyltransferase n=1 Tax=Companilactobacillus insicii TaxID=1732567 RepID=UPI000F793DAA|nr:acyltransferase [Companilactobacillus insicii]